MGRTEGGNGACAESSVLWDLALPSELTPREMGTVKICLQWVLTLEAVS